MRILLVSDNPLATSAYAAQALALAQALQSAGHDVLYFSYGHSGVPLEYKGVRIVGAANMPFGNPQELIAFQADQFAADVIFTVKDPFHFTPDVVRSWQQPWIALAPVDTEPASTELTNALQTATRMIAVTKLGQIMLAQVGLHADYAPLFVDTDYYTPDTAARISFRLNANIPANAFCAALIANNNDPEDRKQFVQSIWAFAEFAQMHPDAVLLLHTELTGVCGGLNLEHLIAKLGLTERNLFVSDQPQYLTGFAPYYVRDLYRASDVLLSFGAEGFGLPVVEAAACGVPAVVCKFGALREVCRSGWMIATDDLTSGEMQWSARGAMRFRPTRRAIVAALEKAYNAKQEEGWTFLTEHSRDTALRYNKDKVIAEHWLPLFADIEAQIKEAVLA